MWYLVWMLGIFLACAFSVITSLLLESFENTHNEDIVK